ncbi:MAG TPA: CBS domain-containing protein [Thermoplasmata archaeon]|nr:CBS domain-containing protein [Thermoplasmata archaeon]
MGSIAWRLPSPIFPDSELSAAWDHLERTACTIVPVMGRNGQYVGVVRRGDLVRLNPGGGMHRPEAAGRGRLEERNVRELLSRFPFGVDRRAPISAAKQAMDDAAVGCVPVVDGVRLVGFVTSVEVLRSYMGTDASADAT